MPRRSPYDIALTEKEDGELRRIVRKYTLPHFLVLRAKMILLAAQGLENKEIAERLDVRREGVVKWRKRFFLERLDGLYDQARPGRPPVFSPSSGRRGESAGL